MENDSAALHRLIMGILLMYRYILTICFFFQAFNQASYVGVGIGKKTNTNNQKNQVAVNIGQASEEDLKLHTFAQLAPPAVAGASENPSSFAPSETFARLGIRSSKDGKAFDLDRQLQIANASSSEINIRKTIYCIVDRVILVD